MTRSVGSRFSAIASGAFRLVEDSFFARVCVIAYRLWHNSRLLSILLAAVLIGCLASAGLVAGVVFSTLRPASTWLIGPVVAAVLSFVVILELSAASVMSGLRGLLRLSYDIGRHRIGALLILLTLGAAAVALLDLRTGATLILGVPLLGAVALALVVIAFWFDRAYRRPAYPGFRDFYRDVVAARQHLARAAHVG